MNQDLTVIVKGRDGTIFEGKATSFSSINGKGKFDILSAHANFISLVGERLVMKLKDGTTKDILVDNGIIKVQENRINVYLGIKK